MVEMRVQRKSVTKTVMNDETCGEVERNTLYRREPGVMRPPREKSSPGLREGGAFL